MLLGFGGQFAACGGPSCLEVNAFLSYKTSSADADRVSSNGVEGFGIGLSARCRSAPLIALGAELDGRA